MEDLHINLPINEQSRGRVEVLVGPERRRRWSQAEKRRIIAESMAPGAVLATVARRHGVHPNQLCGWKRAIRQSTIGPVAEFVPISVAAEPTPGAASEPPCAVKADGQIEVIIGVATVRVPTMVDEATLQRVLSILKGL
jgi:transposase